MASSFIIKLLARGYGAGFNLLSYINSSLAAEWALRVFATPRRGEVAVMHREFLDNAKFKSISAGDEMIQLYHWKGSGPKVLLAHGWESNTHRWRDTVRDLQRHSYDIYALDAPAHGYSTGKRFTALQYAEVLSEVIAIIHPACIIAHSVGAMATIYQQSNTEGYEVEKIVCLGSPDTLLEIMQGYRDLLKFNQKVYDNLNLLLHNKYGYHIKDFNTAYFLRNVPGDVLVVHAQDDQVVSIENGRKLSAVPGTIYKELKTGGHSLRQQEVRNIIIDFLQDKSM